MQNWVKEIVVDSKFENVRTLTEFVENSLEPLNPSPKAIMQIGIAIDELFSNVVRYSGSSNLKLILNVNEDVLTAKLTLSSTRLVPSYSFVRLFADITIIV